MKNKIIKKGFKDYSVIIAGENDIAIIYEEDENKIYYLGELNYIDVNEKILTKNKINKAFIKGIKGYGVIIDHKNHKVIITKDGKKFYCVDMKNQTEEILKILVVENGMTIKYIENQTEELCKIAVLQNFLALEYIRKQTEDICKLALEQEGLLLQYVETQTPELCKIAVAQNCLALRYVENKTGDICKIALKNSYGNMDINNNKKKKEVLK